MDTLYHVTARVCLRQLRTDDFDRLMALDSDPEVMRYLTDGRETPAEEMRQVVDRVLMYQRKWDGRLGVYIAELRESGTFIGWFHLRPDKGDLENVSVLELGYRLRREFWGYGYATEVSRVLVRKAFAEMGAVEVFAQTLAANAASRRVMEKAGLRFERQFMESGRHGNRDVVIYSLRREAFRDATQEPSESDRTNVSR